MRCITACVALGLTPTALSAQVRSNIACESIQLRFIDDSASTAVRHYRSSSSGESYALKDTVALDGRGIEHVDVQSYQLDGDSVRDVIATLTPVGARAFSEATAKHVEQHVAVLIGDEIIQVAIIEGPTRAIVPIRTNVSRQVADSLARRANRARIATCQAP